MRRLLMLIAMLAPLQGLAAPPKSSGAEGPVHVALAPMTVPLFRGSYVQGSFHVKLRLAVGSMDEKHEVERLLPRLEAGYLEMLAHIARSGLKPGEAADIDAIASALQYVTDRVLGHDHARLLIVESAVRR